MNVLEYWHQSAHSLNPVLSSSLPHQVLPFVKFKIFDNKNAAIFLHNGIRMAKFCPSDRTKSVTRPLAKIRSGLLQFLKIEKLSPNVGTLTAQRYKFPSAFDSRILSRSGTPTCAWKYMARCYEYGIIRKS